MKLKELNTKLVDKNKELYEKIETLEVKLNENQKFKHKHDDQCKILQEKFIEIEQVLKSSINEIQNLKKIIV